MSSSTEEIYTHTLIPTAGGGYEVAIYQRGDYISNRYFTNISDAADWGTNYCWGLNNPRE